MVTMDSTPDTTTPTASAFPAVSSAVLRAFLALVDEKVPAVLALRLLVFLVRRAFETKRNEVRVQGALDGLRVALGSNAAPDRQKLRAILDVLASSPVSLPDGRTVPLISWQTTPKISSAPAEIVIRVDDALGPNFVHRLPKITAAEREARHLVPLEVPHTILGARCRYAETKLFFLWTLDARERAERLFIDGGAALIPEKEYRALAAQAGLDGDSIEKLIQEDGQRHTDGLWAFLIEAGRQAHLRRAMASASKEKAERRASRLISTMN